MTTETQNITVGEMRYFKTVKAKGRPFVGEVVKKMGMFTMMMNKNGETVRIKTSLVGKPYFFKPYETKGRLAAAVAEVATA